MATATVKIGGVAQPFKAGSLRISRRTHARSTAQFDIIDRGATQTFQWSQPVQVIGLNGSTVIFGGWIDDIVEDSWQTTAGVSEGMIYRISCKDHHYLADKRVVVGEFVNMRAGEIVKQLITDYLAAEGVTQGAIEDGPIIDRIPADHISAAEVIERVADMANFAWKIDPVRVLSFRSKTAVSAQIAAAGTGMLRGTVKVRRRNYSYRNRQYVISGLSAEAAGLGGVPVTTYTEEFAGDGTKRQFPLAFGIQSAASVKVEVRRGTGGAYVVETFGLGWNPAVIPTGKWYAYGFYPFLNHATAETVLGVNDAVRITYDSYPVRVLEYFGPGPDFPVPGTHSMVIWVDYGNDGTFVSEEFTTSFSDTSKPWYWSPGAGTVRRNEAFTPALTASDKVRLIGVDNSVRDFDYTNSDEVARLRAVEGNTTTGLVEAVQNDMESLSEAESRQRIAAELNRWSSDNIEIEYDTWNSQLAEGEVQIVNLPDHRIANLAFLADQVVITDLPTQGLENQKDSPLRYRVSLVRGVATGAAGGTIGRAANPRTFPDLFGQLNDRVRLSMLRPLLTSIAPGPTIIEPPLTSFDEMLVALAMEGSISVSAAGTPPDGAANLTGWFRAHAIAGPPADGTAISSWANEGSGLDASNDQSAEYPIFKTNQVNGFAAVRGDGSNDNLFCAPGTPSDHLGFQNSHCAIVVARLDATATYADDHVAVGCSGFGNSVHCALARITSGKVSQFVAGAWRDTNTVLTKGQFYVVAWRYSAEPDDLAPTNSHIIRVNNVDVLNTVDYDTTGTMSQAFLLSGPDLNYMKGDLAEVCVYSDPPSLAEFGSIIQGLMTKYAIS